MKIQQRLTPFLSYASQAEEATRFYVSTLPDSKLMRVVSNPTNQAVIVSKAEG